MTPLLKTYLQRITIEHRKLDARGVMQMHRQVGMALDDIYVTLNASIKRERTGGLRLPRYPERDDIRAALAYSAAYLDHGVIVAKTA